MLPCQAYLEGYCSRGSECPLAHSEPSAGPLSHPEEDPAFIPCADFFSVGLCRKGASCPFLHNIDESPERPTIQRTFEHREPEPQQNLPPPTDASPSSVDPFAPCPQYFSVGFCPRGENCPFLHEIGASSGETPPGKSRRTADALASAPASALPQEDLSTVPCPDFFSLGFCRNGFRCPYLHTLGDSDDRPMPAVNPWRTEGLSSQELSLIPCEQFFSVGFCPRGAECPMLHSLLNGPQPAYNPGHTSRENYLEETSMQVPMLPARPITRTSPTGSSPVRRSPVNRGKVPRRNSPVPAVAVAAAAAEPAVSRASQRAERRRAQQRHIVCTEFARHHRCRRGEDCPYSHNAAMMATDLVSRRAQQRENIQRNSHLEEQSRQLDLDHMEYEDLLQLEERIGRVVVGVPAELMKLLPVSVCCEEPTEKSEPCAVCTERIEMGETTRSLPCQHIFHLECIDPWLAEHVECPVCRKDVRK